MAKVKRQVMRIIIEALGKEYFSADIYREFYTNYLSLGMLAADAMNNDAFWKNDGNRNRFFALAQQPVYQNYVNMVQHPVARQLHADALLENEKNESYCKI